MDSDTKKIMQIPHPRYHTTVNLNPVTNLPEAEEAEVSRFDALHANLVLNNPISGMVDQRRLFQPTFEPDPDYKISEDPQLVGEDLMLYGESYSAEQSAYLKEQIERDMLWRKLGAHPGGGWGTFLGIIGDPFIMGTAIATGGQSMLHAAIADISAEVVRESLLHSQQPLRTKLETATNLAVVGMVDGALWKLQNTARGRALQRAMREEAVKYVQDQRSTIDINRPETYGNLNPLGRAEAFPDEPAATQMLDFTKQELQEVADELELPRSGNKTTIMQRIKDYVEETAEEVVTDPMRVSEAGEEVVKGFMPGLGISPLGRIMKSSSDIAKRAAQLLVDTPFRYVKTEVAEEAVPASVEAKIKKALGDFASMAEVFEEQFKAYRKAHSIGFRGRREAMDRFLLEVHRQMETGARGIDPHIDRVSDYFKKFDDAYFSAEQAAGVAGRRRRGGHIMRIYNKAEIQANRTGLRNVIARHLRELPSDKRLVGYTELGDEVYEVVNVREMRDVLDAHPNARLINPGELSEAEYKSLADEMVGSIQGHMLVDDVDPDIIAIESTASKSRMLDFIPTRELEPWLETNALSIMGIRARQHYRAQSMREAFPDDPTMDTVINQVHEEYAELIEKVRLETPGAEKKLLIEQKQVLEDLRGMRDAVHGVYGVPTNPWSRLVRTGRWMRLGALTGYGANIASTSLTDFLTPALRSGLEPFREGLTMLFRNAAKKEYLAQIRKMGVAIEAQTNNKAAMLINMSHVTKGEQRFMKIYGHMTALDWVTDTSQGLNAMSHMQMWKKWADNWANVSDAKKKRLLDVGIDEDMLARIKSEWDEYGDLVDGIRLPTTEKWLDREAAAALENAVRKETFITTIIPGKGDLPLWMQTEPGKFFGMFMSFVAGAHNRLLIAGFQRMDAAFYEGILISAAAGMLVQAGKDLARGKDLSQRDPIEYAVDSIDKTGLPGWFTIPIQPISSLAADRPIEFTWRNFIDQTSPPPIEWAGDVILPLGNILMGQGEGQDFADLAKVTPMLNAFHMIDMAERLHEYQTE